MPENLNRTILLRLTLILAAVVLADKLFLSTGMTPAETESRMEFIRAELARSSNINLRQDLIEEFEKAEEKMAANFSRPQYLESLIGQINIMSVEPSSPMVMSDWADHSMVSYRLRLRMTLAELYASLDALDSDAYPLRVERLRLWSTDQQRQMLLVEMTVNTVVQTTATSGLAGAANSAAAPVPMARKLPEGLLKNIFFPIISDADQPPLAAESVVRRFILSGIDIESQPKRAMLIFPQNSESVWIDIGSAIDDAKLVELDEVSAKFALRDETVRLPLGASSELLLLGKRRFKTNCVISGIVRLEGQYMALASFAAGEGMVLIGVGDVLPTGRIVAVGEEHITLESNGREEIIPLGNSSDNPIYPGYPMMGAGGVILE